MESDLFLEGTALLTEHLQYTPLVRSYAKFLYDPNNVASH